MEFVGFTEVWDQLKARGITESRSAEDELQLCIEKAKVAAAIELGPHDRSRTGEREGSIEVAAERVAPTLEAVLRKLHLAPLYLVPITRWRDVFDVVAFGLASNEHWQEVDSQASVELNTRDPLVCGPADLHTLRDLVRTLLTDGEAGPTGIRQGLTVVATGQLMVATVIPGKPIRITIGNSKVADQVRDAAVHYLEHA